MSSLTTPQEPKATAEQQGVLKRSIFFVAFAALMTTLPQDQVFGFTPLRFLLKDHLHVTPARLSLFFLLSGFAWYLKPIFGLIVDGIPLFGTRRRWYMILSSSLGAAMWLMMGLVPRTYQSLLYVDIALGVMMVFASTIMGALLVEVGQRFGATGRISSLREGIQDATFILSGPLGGWLAKKDFLLTAGIGGAFLVSLAVVAWFFLPEKPIARPDGNVWREAGRQFKVLGKSGTLWAAAGLTFLFFLAPGFSTPLLFVQSNQLHLSDQFVGNLTAVDGVGQVIGAVAYGLLCRRMRLRPLLLLGIGLAALSPLLYLHYHTKSEVVSVELLYNALTIFGCVPLYDMAARATPRGCEGIGYALMMSVRNFALKGGDYVGSKMFQGQWHISALHVTLPHMPFPHLVWVNAISTAIALLLVPLLPRVLVTQREGELLGDPHATGEQISGAEPTPRVP